MYICNITGGCRPWGTQVIDGMSPRNYGRFVCVVVMSVYFAVCKKKESYYDMGLLMSVKIQTLFKNYNFIYVEPKVSFLSS